MQDEIDWHAHFYYDETSPTFLRWKHDVINGRGVGYVRLPAGSVAGSKKKKRYAHVMLEMCDYPIHIIIWKLFHGLPNGTVDHIDGDSHNNCITNLRVIPFEVNCRNKKKQVTNSSGVTGVSCTSNGKSGNYYWTAFWKNPTKRLPSQKCFSISKLGLLPAFAAAVKYRKAMIEQLNLQGAGYTERHGT
jgi:hypothetical protein